MPSGYPTGGGRSAVQDLAAILSAILDGYILSVNGFHGVVHWARVLENGLRIAEANTALTRVPLRALAN